MNVARMHCVACCARLGNHAFLHSRLHTLVTEHQHPLSPRWIQCDTVQHMNVR